MTPMEQLLQKAARAVGLAIAAKLDRQHAEFTLAALRVKERTTATEALRSAQALQTARALS